MGRSEEETYLLHPAYFHSAGQLPERKKRLSSDVHGERRLMKSRVTGVSALPPRVLIPRFSAISADGHENDRIPTDCERNKRTRRSIVVDKKKFRLFWTAGQTTEFSVIQKLSRRVRSVWTCVFCPAESVDRRPFPICRACSRNVTFGRLTLVSFGGFTRDPRTRQRVGQSIRRDTW